MHEGARAGELYLDSVVKDLREMYAGALGDAR